MKVQGAKKILCDSKEQQRSSVGMDARMDTPINRSEKKIQK
jgi:hypothetical protein